MVNLKGKSYGALASQDFADDSVDIGRAEKSSSANDISDMNESQRDKPKAPRRPSLLEKAASFTTRGNRKVEDLETVRKNAKNSLVGLTHAKPNDAETGEKKKGRRNSLVRSQSVSLLHGSSDQNSKAPKRGISKTNSFLNRGANRIKLGDDSDEEEEAGFVAPLASEGAEKPKRSKQSMRRMQSERHMGGDGRRRSLKSSKSKSERHLKGSKKKHHVSQDAATSESDDPDVGEEKRRRSKKSKDKLRRAKSKQSVSSDEEGGDEGGSRPKSPRKQRRRSSEDGDDKKSRKSNEYLQFDPTNLNGTVSVGEERNAGAKEKGESKSANQYLQFDPTNMNGTVAMDADADNGGDGNAKEADEANASKDYLQFDPSSMDGPVEVKHGKHSSKHKRSKKKDDNGQAENNESSDEKSRPQLTRGMSASNGLNRGGKVVSKSNSATAYISTRNLKKRGGKKKYGQMMDDDDTSIMPEGTASKGQEGGGDELDQILNDCRSSKTDSGRMRRTPGRTKSSDSFLEGKYSPSISSVLEA